MAVPKPTHQNHQEATGEPQQEADPGFTEEKLSHIRHFDSAGGQTSDNEDRRLKPPFPPMAAMTGTKLTITTAS